MYSRIICRFIAIETTAESEGTGYLSCGQVRSHCTQNIRHTTSPKQFLHVEVYTIRDTDLYKHLMYNKQPITLTLASLIFSCEGDG